MLFFRKKGGFVKPEIINQILNFHPKAKIVFEPNEKSGGNWGIDIVDGDKIIHITIFIPK